MGVSVKYEFASPEWFACLHGIICERAAAVSRIHPDLTYSLCEVFLNAPASSPLRSGSIIAWHAIIRGAEVDFGLSEVADTDVEFKVYIEFDEVPPLSRYDTKGDPARALELTSLVQDVIARGRCRMIGERPKASSIMGTFHDAIARLTA